MLTFISNTIILFIFLLLSACASIDIRSVDQDELTVKISIVQQPQATAVDVYLSRGAWSQPVSMNDASIDLVMAHGDVIALQPARDKGRYGIRLPTNQPIDRLIVETVGEVTLPYLAPVSLLPLDQLEGQTYFKDDIVTLDLPESNGDERTLVVTGYCGKSAYTTEQKLTSDTTSYQFSLTDVAKRLNQAAKADLNGLIPIELSIEERYFVDWASPFVAKKLAVRDTAQFQLDTAGARFKARVSIQVSNSLFLGFQNQPWPVNYCF